MNAKHDKDVINKEQPEKIRLKTTRKNTLAITNILKILEQLKTLNQKILVDTFQLMACSNN
ncbi:hypothetical protein HZS_4589 [Henneguya salminicola]|nr:hypothetical protein HZS_4589 [Henneguya salminicola]